MVRRIFEAVGAGKSLRSIKKGLKKDRIPTPGQGRFWSMTYLKQLIAHDAYRPHTYEELQGLVSPDVVAQLDPNESYGIWWFGRRRHHQGQKSENGPDGRRYRKTKKSVWLDREKWIAVPVPDSGIPRETIDIARESVKTTGPRQDRRSLLGALGWDLAMWLVRPGDVLY